MKSETGLEEARSLLDKAREEVQKEFGDKFPESGNKSPAAPLPTAPETTKPKRRRRRQPKPQDVYEDPPAPTKVKKAENTSPAHIQKEFSERLATAQRQYREVQSLSTSIDKIIEAEHDEVLLGTYNQGKQMLWTGGEILQGFSDPEVLAYKVMRTPPDKLAYACTTLITAGAKLLAEVRTIFEDIYKLKNPPPTIIEIQGTSLETVYKEQGEFLPACRVVEVRENTVTGTPLDAELVVRGKRCKVTQVIATVQWLE